MRQAVAGKGTCTVAFTGLCYCGRENPPVQKRCKTKHVSAYFYDNGIGGSGACRAAVSTRIFQAGIAYMAYDSGICRGFAFNATVRIKKRRFFSVKRNGLDKRTVGIKGQ